MQTLRHDDKEATNRYRCSWCRKRWANDIPGGFEDACPRCNTVTSPLTHGMTVRQRFAVYWTVVFVVGWGFGAATGYGWCAEGLWWPS